MGFRDLVTGRTRGLLSSVTLPFSPYSPAPEWPSFVIDDLTSGELKKQPMSRKTAMSIPAVSKARNLIISTIANKPLRALRHNADGTDTDVTTSYPWLYRTNGPVGPYERMAWTLDDLIFYGCSLWLVDRGAPENKDDPESRRPIINASYCPYKSWKLVEVDGYLAIAVDGVPIAEENYIFINSPFEGLLTVGKRTLRGALDVEESWVGRARNPIPLINLKREDDTLDDVEAQALVDGFALARTGPNGMVSSTPPGIQLEVFGELEPELMAEGRNGVRTDVGSFVNIRAAMLDGTIGIDSLTYTTKDGEKNSYYELDVPFWTDPFADRMSLDDVVPRGTRIRFDFYEAFNLPTPTGPTAED